MANRRARRARPIRVRRQRDSEAGAALMTVLLLVAILAVIATIALDRLVLASRTTRNIVASEQGRAYLLSAEQIAALRIADLIRSREDRTTLEGNWLGTPQTMTVPGGVVTATVRDADNCFNLNSLVQPAVQIGQSKSAQALEQRPLGISEFSGLMRALGVDPRTADQVAMSAADWIDSDSAPGQGGAEDDFYLGMDPPYRAANSMMADPSELRMVGGMTPELYERLRPWVCALPVVDLSPLNINTLLPEQGALIAMFAPDKIGAEQARQLLARRPVDGYGSTVDFWAPLPATGLPEMVTQQVKQKSRWFEVVFSADLGGDKVQETVLYDAGGRQVRIVRRQWSGDGD